MTYDYGTHEVLDRTYIVMELLSYVSEQPQVLANPEWAALTQSAHDALWKLYRAVGSMKDDDAKALEGEK